MFVSLVASASNAMSFDPNVANASAPAAQPATGHERTLGDTVVQTALPVTDKKYIGDPLSQTMVGWLPQPEVAQRFTWNGCVPPTPLSSQYTFVASTARAVRA